ncbi:MAG: hypothetical protein ACREUQ_08370 [Burkholderiales bacterium]
MKVIESHPDWENFLRREYPGVTFRADETHPQGINAVSAGVLVGRFFVGRNPQYGVVFDQPRSCGGKY